jgi:putative aldouronate transport system substrate-binding protein
MYRATPVANAPKAPSRAAVVYDDAFDSYPKNPTRALSGDPPGTGSKVSIMSISLFPPPTPFAQNRAWQAVNKEINADIQYSIVTSADYPVKLATVMAGSDLPDMIYMYAQPGSSSTLAAAAGIPQFLQSQAADLTPYLAGDAAKDYPFLAAIPTPAWKNAGCAYQGHLHGADPSLSAGQVFRRKTGLEQGDWLTCAQECRRLQTHPPALTKPQQDSTASGPRGR